ncbi:major facilitator family transporter, partial [Acidithiobacillus sp. GGI-221]
MHTIHALLDDLKINKQHRRIVLAAGLGIFLDGYDLSIIAVALLLLKPDWHLSAVATGLLGAATLAGAALGGLVGGRIADLLGRKVLYLIDVAAFFMAALLSGVAWDVSSLIIFRFFLGVGVGMDYPLSSSYIAEFMPKAQRGAGLSWAFTLWMIGAVVSAVVGLVLLQAGPNAWRWMFISGAFPALAVLWLRRNLPETPRWYIAHNRPEEAIQVLQSMSPEVDAQSLREALQRQAPELVQIRAWATLFAPQWLRRTLLVVIPWMMVDISVYGLIVYLPILLEGFGIHSHTDALVWNVLFDLIALCGIASLALSTRRIGRVFPQIAGFALNAFFLGVLGLVALYMHPPIWLLIVTI